VSPLQQQQQQQQQQYQQSCVVLSPVSAVVSQGFALFPLSFLRLGINNSSQGMADRAGKSSSRRSAWKRFPIVLGMCFIVGVLLGLLTPDNWTSSSSSSDTAKSGQDLASSDFIEGIKVENVASSGEVANALEETSGIGTKSRELVGVDAVANLSSIMLDPGSFFCLLFLSRCFCVSGRFLGHC
jgi:hypothetical protein